LNLRTLPSLTARSGLLLFSPEPLFLEPAGAEPYEERKKGVTFEGHLVGCGSDGDRLGLNQFEG